MSKPYNGMHNQLWISIQYLFALSNLVFKTKLNTVTVSVNYCLIMNPQDCDNDIIIMVDQLTKFIECLHTLFS